MEVARFPLTPYNRAVLIQTTCLGIVSVYMLRIIHFVYGKFTF